MTATAIRLSGAVMVHPRRMDTALDLVASAKPGFLSVVLDPRPDEPVSLRTPMLAWSSIPAESTHHLVLEDDATLAPGFVEHAERAATVAPDAAIAFYTNWNSRNGAAVRLAALARARWATATAEYTPTVALLLPADVGAGFADYAREYGGTWPDDVVMARYLESRRVRTLLTVPNLVQHGDLPSLSGNDSHGLRQAACFAAPPPDTDWDAHNRVDLDVVPFFEFGTARCAIRHPSDGRFQTVGPTRFVPRLGVDIADCQRTFTDALAARPAIGQSVGHAVLNEFWQVGYLMGFLGRQADQTLELEELFAAWKADPLVDAALTSLGPGGLCTSHDPATLAWLSPQLLMLAEQALRCGAHASDGGGRQQHTGRRPSTVLVSPPRNTFAQCLADDLVDRGYEVAGPDSTHVHTVVHVTEADGDDCRELVERARASGVSRVVIVAASSEAPARPPDPFVRVLAIGVPYGPGVTGYSPVNRLVDQALQRQTMTVPAGTPGRYHLAHVWDVADALHEVLSSDRQPAIPAIGAPVSLRRVAEVIAEVVNPVDINVDDATPEGTGIVRRESVSLADGIRSVAQWLAYEVDRTM